MTTNIVSMTRSARLDRQTLRREVRQFGWSMVNRSDLNELLASPPPGRTIGLFFDREAVGSDYSWMDVVQRLRSELPGVHLIACHGFSESFDWPKLSDAGALHSIWLPLREEEVRQSLGFIWAAEKRLNDSAEKPRTLVASAGAETSEHTPPPRDLPHRASRKLGS